MESGGFYPRAWQWGSLAALVVVAVAAVTNRGLELSRGEWLMLAALAGFVAWTGLTSVATDHAATLGVPELERAGLYLALFWAAAALPPRRSPLALPAGLLAGTVIVCIVGLARFLFPSAHQAPDTFEGRNLFEPIGYANAFGILMGIGALIAVGLAGGSARRVDRALAAGALVPLLTAFALTSSRGAVVAVGIGLVTTLTIDHRRGFILATLAKTLLLPVVAIAVALHSRVTDSHVSIDLVARDGRIVGITIAALTLAASVSAYFTLADERRRDRFPRVVLIGGGVVGVAAIVVALTRAHAALGDRPQYWHAAWLDVLHHPLFGIPRGQFRGRVAALSNHRHLVEDAHNLYLETLAELGPVGLALLVITLTIPLRHLSRALRTPAVGSVCGAYVAFLAHSAIDWDWEMPVVTLSGLICAATLLHARQATSEVEATDRHRVAAIVAVAGTGVALFALNTAALAGNGALHQAVEKLQSKAWLSAARSAHTAARWQPWSAEPYDLLGQAQVARGQRAAAAESFRHALRLDDNRWQTWYELGRIGSPVERRAALERILVLNPLAVRTNR